MIISRYRIIYIVWTHVKIVFFVCVRAKKIWYLHIKVDTFRCSFERTQSGKERGVFAFHVKPFFWIFIVCSFPTWSWTLPPTSQKSGWNSLSCCDQAFLDLRVSWMIEYISICWQFILWLWKRHQPFLGLWSSVDYHKKKSLLVLGLIPIL